MYAKIFDDIFDSTLANDPMTRHIFMDLLVLADLNGVVDMTPSAIARRINLPIDTVLSALSALSAPDTQSRSPKADGRRIVLLDEHRDWGWQIVNFKDRHAMRDSNARREANKRYQRERRERNKACQHPVSTCQHPSAPSAHTDIDTDIDTDKEDLSVSRTKESPKPPSFTGSFLNFWTNYPPKGRERSSRPEAWKVWKKEGCELVADRVLESLASWIESEKWHDSEGQFIDGAAKWLRGRHWEDADPEPYRKTNGKALPGPLRSIYGEDDVVGGVA